MSRVPNGIQEPEQSGATDPVTLEMSIRIEEAGTEPAIDPCSICLDPQCPPVESLSCAHQFHADCWDGWVAEKARDSRAVELQIPCPLCRTPQDVVISRQPDSPVAREEYDEVLEYICMNRNVDFCIVVIASVVFGAMYGFIRCVIPPSHISSCSVRHPYLVYEAIGVATLTGIATFCCVRKCFV